MGEIPPNTEAAPAPPNIGQAQTDQPEIPDKLYFRIGEVSHLIGVEAYVLRYWESEFPGLSPRKSSSGQRMFRRKDVELLLRIKHLLYSQKFTIEGARKALSDQNKEKTRQGAAPKAAPVKQADLFAADPMAEIRKQVFDIIEILSGR